MEHARCLVIRYGGIGDMLMASSILPGLKAKGFHVTLQCTPSGHDVMEHDPHIDAFWIQDKDQVPNHELQGYWQALAGEFDHIVNLCESVEGALLAIPDRRTYALPKYARHLLMDVNYQEFTHAIAEVSFPVDHGPQQRFYPNLAEANRAAGFRKRLGDVPVVLWAPNGSSVHKIWTGIGATVCEVLAKTDAKFVFVGARDDQIIEFAVAQEVAKAMLGLYFEESNQMKLADILLRLKNHYGQNRLICKAGNWSIRETLAFVEQADVVIGPETGVLNAAAMLPMPKVIMLSHSTALNLTRHWVNTAAIEPWDAPCYPCHRMHYGWDTCNRDEGTGTAVCAASITPAMVGEPIKEAIAAWYMSREAAE